MNRRSFFGICAAISFGAVALSGKSNSVHEDPVSDSVQRLTWDDHKKHTEVFWSHPETKVFVYPDA